MKDYYKSEDRKKNYIESAMIVFYAALIFICLLLGFGFIKLF